ncbi:MAG: pentapeptide repeat-containing protein [Bacillota bacterium]|nr:pentapeptide repeat-containing protein [Bacillota bacterium]
MKKIEALQHFNDNYVKEKRDQKLKELDEFYNINRDVLAKDILEAFRNVCVKAGKLQLEGIKENIAYISFSMVRVKLLNNDYKYFVDAYNEILYLDEVQCRSYYDASWAFRFLEEFEKELEQSRKLYINKILKSDIEKIKLQDAALYNDYIVKLATYVMPEAVKIKEYLDLKREEVVDIRVGEYKASRQVVYKEDLRIKDSGSIKSWLEGKYELEYEHEVLRNLDLSGGDYEGIDLSYSDFTGSDLSKSNWRKSTLIGANFYKANLDGVDFGQADLSDCDLREAILKNTSFAGAQLQGARFLEKDISLLNLDEVQKKDIIAL